jgi:hypothetical protein
MSRTFTRREVLGAGLGLAGATFALGFGGLGAFARAASASHLAEATYRPLVGEVFTVHAPGGPIELTLAATRGFGPLRHGSTLLSGRQNFALDFSGPLGLESGTHDLSHPAIGRFQLFLNPVGRAGASQIYESVINTYDVTIGRNNHV